MCGQFFQSRISRKQRHDGAGDNLCEQKTKRGGYRSADYTSSTYSGGVWTQTAITHATSATILNYYFNTAAGVYSYIYVSFDYANMRYNITAYCTQASELYLFNYDPTVYTVYVNGAPVIAGSNVVHINATMYDFETGWAT